MNKQLELQNPYAKYTNNLLDGVILHEGIFLYNDENIPQRRSVPGSLEFVGLYSIIERLKDGGLEVYFPKFDYKYIPDLFFNKDEKERIALLKQVEPPLLRIAIDSIFYYHKTRILSHVELNDLVDVKTWRQSHRGISPFSNALENELESFYDTLMERRWNLSDEEKEIKRVMIQEFRLRVLNEIADRLRKP